MLNKIYQSNCNGPVEVIKQNGNNVTVRFLETGFERTALGHNVRKGKVKDTTVKYVPPTVVMNLRVESNSTGWYTILSKTGRKCIVQFDETGYTKEADIENAKVGKVRDLYFKSVYSRGYEGEFDRKSLPYWKQAKQLWCNMLKRCYSEKDTRGYYGKGVTVDGRWLCFANFVEDISKLENFDKWLEGFDTGFKYNLDKDLKIEGNKVYSRELCSFVTEYENKSAGSLNMIKKYGPCGKRHKILN